MSRIARTVNLNEVSDQEFRYYKGPLKVGMYRIVILPDNRLIEAKPDSRISCNFLEPDSDIRLIALPDIRPDNTGYPAR